MNRKSSQEPSELKVVFTNKENPLEDPIMLRAECDMTKTKRKIANIESSVRSSFQVIQLAKEQCQGDPSNHIIAADKIASGTGKMVELIQKLRELETLGDHATAILEEMRIQFRNTHEAVCKKLNAQEESIKRYRERVMECEKDAVEYFTSPKQNEQEKSAEALSKKHAEMNHLMPKILSSKCSVAEFESWRKSFEIWMKACYTRGYNHPQLWNCYVSRVDSV